MKTSFILTRLLGSTLLMVVHILPVRAMDTPEERGSNGIFFPVHMTQAEYKEYLEANAKVGLSIDRSIKIIEDSDYRQAFLQFIQPDPFMKDLGYNALWKIAQDYNSVDCGEALQTLFYAAYINEIDALMKDPDTHNYCRWQLGKRLYKNREALGRGYDYLMEMIYNPDDLWTLQAINLLDVYKGDIHAYVQNPSTPSDKRFILARHLVGAQNEENQRVGRKILEDMASNTTDPIYKKAQSYLQCNSFTPSYNEVIMHMSADQINLMAAGLSAIEVSNPRPADDD